ncbi:DUF4232 domain-containing protein [Phycicoccus sonneratiae]|uniref:DUF4232 domain-containing protein n=1 Tax=Phycicoccus sonneratiae TaxID=2807628 RepID=A0ABS2CJ95_9MICO|nr:DUF4232 domain-containing protein [Phycicoccus sonneraticus]MBM6399947.1 DUF4232 domain-containing protein [Phycicoccus sonneraticus]
MSTHPARPVLVVAALVATLGATACGNGLESDGAVTGSGPSTTSSSSGSPSPATPAPGESSPSSDGTGTSPSATSTSGTSGTSGSSGDDRTGRCTLGHLAVGARSPEGGGSAGSSYLLLTFRNTGSGTCVLSGFPGVSFVGKGDGTQLGAPAVRTGSARTVDLAAGGSTTALLRIADAGAYDERSCAPTTADGFRVYPPGSTEAAYVEKKVQVCQGSTGGSPQLTIASVGTSG